MNENPDHTPVFAGDLFDRGPEHDKWIPWVIENKPLCVMGNHDWKLYQFLSGRDVRVSYPGIKTTLDCLAEHPEWIKPLRDYLGSLPYLMTLYLEASHKLVCVAHGYGIPNWFDAPTCNNPTSEIKDMAIYRREDCSKHWDEHPDRIFVHGHVPLQGPWVRGKHNNVYGIDTACCFGGKLTGLKLPEFEFVYAEGPGFLRDGVGKK